MLQAGFLYNAIVSKKKERFDIILEPLQAFIQIALLAFTPVDSKLNIYNNILYIQIPGWKQSIMRTYYSDSKNDLFFLFNVIKRFNTFYKHLISIQNKDTNLFKLLKELSNKGIDNLLQTYKQTENPALLHTLNIYKDILNNKNVNTIVNENVNTNVNINEIDDDDAKSISNLFDQQLDTPYASPASSPSISSSNNPSIVPSISLSHLPLVNQPTTIDIDNVFINITKLYTEYDLLIIFNTLLLIQTNPNNYIEYIEGLNRILEPINNQIKKWIVDNIVY
jgi:hypothetical protein